MVYTTFSGQQVQVPVWAGVLSFVLFVLTIIELWCVFKKAGRPGWAALVPFYNMYTLFDIAWGKGWMFLTIFIPFVNVVIGIMLYLKLAKAFGKSTGFGVGLIFLGVIFMGILGFGSAQYLGVPQKETAA